MGLVLGEHGAEAGIRHARRGSRRAHPLPYATRRGRPIFSSALRATWRAGRARTHRPVRIRVAGAPTARTAVMGLGAGVGVGMGYTDCKVEFDQISKEAK